MSNPPQGTGHRQWTMIHGRRKPTGQATELLQLTAWRQCLGLRREKPDSLRWGWNGES